LQPEGSLFVIMPHLIASLIMAYTPMIRDKWTYYN